MSLPRVLGLVSLFAVGVACPGMGCSSSSKGGGNSPPADDSGIASNHDSGMGTKDSSVTASDSSTSSSDSGGDGGTCTPASTASYTAPTYVAAVGHQGVCSAAQISAFVAACGDNGSTSPCQAWQSSNVVSDAGAGTTCGNCILAPMNNGGVWVDPDGFLNPNYAGCVQLSDPTHGAACAAAFNDESGCEDVACDACSSDTSFGDCVNTVDMGSCSSYVTASNSACATDEADGGVLDQCRPGAATNTIDPDYTLILSLICGSGISDGGATD